MEGRMVAITRYSDKADIRQIVGRDTASLAETRHAMDGAQTRLDPSSPDV
jgi:hypothetical protein